MSSSYRFITSNGTLINSRSRSYRESSDARISKFKIFMFTLLLAVLAITNPPNYFYLNGQIQKRFSFSWKLWGYEFDLMYRADKSNNGNKGRSKFGTNFIFYTLDDRALSIMKRKVLIGAFLTEVTLCEYNILEETSICSYIATNICHDMEVWSRKDRAYTAHRILASMLIASVILSFCRKTDGPTRELEISLLEDSYECSIRNVASWENMKYRPLSVLMSVFYRPSLIFDLLLLNVVAYGPLILLEKAVNIASKNKTPLYNDLHYAWSVFTCFVIIGSISNLAASVATGRGCYGSMGAFAALLGYHTAQVPTKILIHSTYTGFDTTSVDILVLLTMIEIINSGQYLDRWLPFKLHDINKNAFFLLRREGTSSPVAWVVGGLLGIAFGHYQIERYSLHWRLW